MAARIVMSRLAMGATRHVGVLARSVGLRATQRITTRACVTSSPTVMRSIHTSAPPSSNIKLGDEAPDFTQESTQGTINFHEWVGDSWAILFSHPKDYTPVCTTELGYMQSILPEFEKRNVKVLALSVDSVEEHAGWVNDITDTQGVSAITYPILADLDRSVAQKYGMLDESNINNDGLPATVRSVFVIGPDKLVKLIITYPASTGRNFDEVLRVVDSLQLTAYKKVATPVNWKSGQDCVIVPTVSDEEAKTLFPGGWKTLRPYLRLVPDPSEK